jgi:RNA polymerase sigma factor (sigma-70 family)
VNVLLAAIDEHKLIESALQSKAWSHSPEDLKDLGQEIRLKLINYLLRWKGETSLHGLLRTMAGSRSHDLARYLDRRPADPCACLPEPTILAPRLSSLVVDQERMRLALSRLPPRYSEPLTFRYLEGHTVAETARLVGIKEAAMRRILITGRKRLKLVMTETAT